MMGRLIFWFDTCISIFKSCTAHFLDICALKWEKRNRKTWVWITRWLRITIHPETWWKSSCYLQLNPNGISFWRTSPPVCPGIITIITCYILRCLNFTSLWANLCGLSSWKWPLFESITASENLKYPSANSPLQSWCNFSLLRIII